MANYHFSAKPISRKSGKSAVASISYRRGEIMRDDRYQVTHDYRQKTNVLHSEISISNGAPEWCKRLINLHETDKRLASEQLWNFVESVENRVDSQLAREIEFSLPLELDFNQNIALARDYICDQFVSRGMIADWSIHWDKGNPHVHVMLTMRELTESGFGLKVTAWNSKALLYEWREKWAEYANFHLKLHNHDVRIDHRSYKDQGIDLVPGIHHGSAVSRMHKKGIETAIMDESNNIRRENLTRIGADPEILLKKITLSSPTFTREDLAAELGRYVDDKGEFSRINHALKQLDVDRVSEHVEGSSEETQPVLSPALICQILEKIEAHHSVFGEREIAQALSAHTDHAELFAAAVLELKASDQIIALGVGDDGRERFTTRSMFELENKVLQITDELRNRSGFAISTQTVTSTLTAYEKERKKTLTEEQRAAVLHMTQPNAISCLVGRAGTGKSFTLSAARHIWENAGLNVYGVALSGIAADGLSKDAGIDSRTIASFQYAIENKQIILTHKSVVVMDEAGMTDSPSMLAVLSAVRDAKAKLVPVGDHAQLQPVGAGAVFRGMLERIGFGFVSEIKTIYRQEADWQKEATTDLAAGRTNAALEAYNEHGCVHIEESYEDTVQKLVNDWMARRASHPDTGLKEFLAIAYENKDVDRLNQLLRNSRVAAGEISEGYTTTTSKKVEIKLSQGDRILFLKNDRLLGVNNGRFATIESVNFTESGKIIHFTAKLDGSDKTVLIDPRDYSDFAHGYAATIHKVQGVTVDHTFNYVGKAGWNRHTTYVASTRHRYQYNLYANQSDHKDIESLKTTLRRYGIKDSVLDFPLAFAQRRGIDTTPATALLPIRLANRLITFKDTLADRYQQYKNPVAYWEKKEAQLKAHLTQQERIESLTQDREHAKLVLHYANKNREVGVAYEALQMRLVSYSIATDSSSNTLPIFHLPEYKVFQAAIAERNAAALPIHQAPERFTKALDIHGVSLEKIGKEAQIHERRLLVSDYQQLLASGNVVHRDRLAALMMQDVKSHYGHFKSANVDITTLKQHARRHIRNTQIIKLSTDERKVFYAVEEYQKISAHIGKQYSDIRVANAEPAKERNDKKENIKDRRENRNTQLLLDQCTRERERLAAYIIKNKTHATTALSFHQIGTYAPLFTPFDSSKEAEYQQQAEARLEKLEKAAIRHHNYQRIEKYITAHRSQDQIAARASAHEIVADINGHHGAILNQADLPSEIWQAIRKDAKLYERDRLFEALSPEAQKNFILVEAYVYERRESARNWAAVFKAKEAGTDIEQQAKLAELAKIPMLARDKLAFEINKNLDDFKDGLTFFDVNPEHLQKAAYAQLCREYVDLYRLEKDIMMRAQIANIISKDPRAHNGAMIDAGISWRQLYKDRMPVNKQILFSTLSRDEKHLMRLSKQYQKANRHVGRKFSKLFAGKKSNGKIDTHVQMKADLLLSKRDYLANRLIDAKQYVQTLGIFSADEQSNPVEQVEKLYTFNWEKIESQAQKHIGRISDIESWKSTQEPADKILPYLLKQVENNTKKSTLNIDAYLSWTAAIDDATKAAQPITQRINGYTYAIQSVGLNKKIFQEKLNKQTELKATISQLSSTDFEQNSTTHECDIDLEKRIARARMIARGARPIHGTLAEKYLREHRGIQGPLSKSYSYHPATYHGEVKRKLPALVVAAKNIKDEITAVQVVFLDEKTGNKAKLNTAKLTFGSLTQENTGVLVNSGKNTQTIAIAEGPETALSVAEANPDLRVYAVLGSSNFTRTPIFKDTKNVLFCADNDGKNSASQKKLFHAAQTLAQRGVNVFQAMPDKEKQDFNDLLKLEGKEAVRRKLDTATLLQRERSPEKVVGELAKLSGVEIKEQESRKFEEGVPTAFEASEDNAQKDLENLLKNYVKKHSEFLHLVNQKIIHMSKDRALSKRYSDQSIALKKEIHQLAKDALKNPVISDALIKEKEKYGHTDKKLSITDIQQKIDRGQQLSKNDMTMLLNKLAIDAKSAVWSHNRSHKQDGGRKY
jgi:Ti-type conjugative transfer relaxase TraA